MQYQGTLKKKFLKKWIKGLQSITPTKLNNMTFIERKKAIKLSSNLAMASTRNSSSTSWSKSVIATAYEDEETRDLANTILGRRQLDRTKWSLSSKDKHRRTRRISSTISGCSNKKKVIISKKISKFRKNVPRKFGLFNSYKIKARLIAKNLVEKRVKILKGLVPGGECMDEFCLINETLDYIVSLRAQVDVMHYFANSF